MVENPMIIDAHWGPIRPRYHEVIDDNLGERWIVDEYGREIDPALLCPEEKEDDENCLP
jgi:hypothetical protein